MSEMIERAADAILAKVPLGYGMTRPEALEYAPRRNRGHAEPDR